MQTYLKKLSNKHATKPLVIIDEVDFLVKKQDMEVIYNLLELRGLKLVMCANSINFIGELGQDRVGSRMSSFKRINLPDYEADDYRQLLKIRFESGKPKLDLAQLADEKALKLLVARCKM